MVARNAGDVMGGVLPPLFGKEKGLVHEHERWLLPGLRLEPPVRNHGLFRLFAGLEQGAECVVPEIGRLVDQVLCDPELCPRRVGEVDPPVQNGQQLGHRGKVHGEFCLPGMDEAVDAGV